MQHYLRQYGSQHITVSLLTGGRLHCLRDRTSQTSRRPRKFLIDPAADIRLHRRRRRYFRSVSAHHLPAERLLLIRAFHHIYLTVQLKIGTSHGERRSPLPCARLRRHTLKPLLLRIVSLRDRGIQLVASRRVVALKFVINMSRCAKPFFQTVCPHKRRRAVHLIEITNLCGNIEISRLIIQFLLRQLLTEDARKLLHRDRLQCFRI